MKAGRTETGFTADAWPGEKDFRAEIVRVDPTVRENTRTITVELMVDLSAGGAGERLKPGMSARVPLTIEIRRGVVVVSAENVIREGRKRYVFLTRPGKNEKDEAITVAKRVEVVLGIRQGDRVEVVSGLEPGDPLIVGGQSRLTDGAEIRIITGEPDASPGGGTSSEE